MRYIASLILLFLIAFTGTALAADPNVSVDPSVSEAFKAIMDAITKGQWWAVAAYGVILAVIGARKIMPASWKEGAKGDIIGVATTFVMAFAGAIGTWALAAGAGAAFTSAVALTALKIGAAAIGGYTVIHKLAGWLVASGVLPAWAAPIVKLLAGLVGSNAVKKAEAAGDKAVAAKPTTGTAGDKQIVEIE